MELTFVSQYPAPKFPSLGHLYRNEPMARQWERGGGEDVAFAQAGAEENKAATSGGNCKIGALTALHFGLLP